MHHLDPLIVNHIVILLAKTRGDIPGDQRFDVANHDAVNAGMRNERASRDPRSARHHQNIFRIGEGHRGNVPQHPLQSHVARVVGGLNLAGGVEASHTIGAHRHRHGAVQTFPHVLAISLHAAAALRDLVFLINPRLQLVAISRYETPVGNHSPRQNAHIARQKNGQPQRAEHSKRANRAERGFFLRRAGGCALPPEHWHEHHQPGHHRQYNQHPLRPLRAGPRDQQQAEPQGAQNRADGIGRINSAHQPARILSTRRHRRQGERKARAP